MSAPEKNAVAVPQQRGRNRLGRPPLTDRPTLLDAALRIGFDRLTVGAVTSRCGVKYSTFYRHFVSLDALVAAMVDETLDANPVPEHDNWRDQLAAAAADLRHVLELHPGMAGALAALDERDARPAWLTQAQDVAVDRMLTAGLPAALAAAGAATVFRLATLPPDTVDEQAVGIVLDGIAARGWTT